MTKVILIHGSYDNPKDNWFPWLKEKLEKNGIEVIIPKFPTPEKQSLTSWLNVFDKYKSKLNSDTILVGHGLGSAFIMSAMEREDVKIKGAFFVAGFIGLLSNDKFDTITRTFMEKSFDIEKISSNLGKITIYASDNDPFIPLKYANELANRLEIKPIIISDAGHFDSKAGYNKFERLLKDITKLIKQ